MSRQAFGTADRVVHTSDQRDRPFFRCVYMVNSSNESSNLILLHSLLRVGVSSELGCGVKKPYTRALPSSSQFQYVSLHQVVNQARKYQTRTFQQG